MKKADCQDMNIFISQAVKLTLPDVLTDYLFGLVRTDAETPGDRHSFLLRKNQLSDREIQDIFHFGENGSLVLHRVFGYSPVDAEITITCDSAGYHMTAVNEERDAA